jgi:hypothetical protein
LQSAPFSSTSFVATTRRTNGETALRKGTAYGLDFS